MAADFTRAEQANQTAVPVIKNIFGVSADFLGELKTWLEMNPPAIPISQIVGFQQNSVVIYKKAVGELDVANTVTETDIVNEVIPAGKLGTTGAMRLTVLCDYKNDTGANKNLTVKFYMGSLVDTITITGVTATATKYPFSLEFLYANQNATNSQILSTFYPFPSLTTTNDVTLLQRLPVTSAVDTTVSNTMRVTVTHSAASASLVFRRFYYMIEFL